MRQINAQVDAGAEVYLRFGREGSKLYAELGPITAFVFHNDVSNPFPQVSAIVPIDGPFAFQGPGSGKTGGGLRFRASF